MATLLTKDELWRCFLHKEPTRAERKRRSFFDIVSISGYVIAGMVLIGAIFFTFYWG